MKNISAVKNIIELASTDVGFVYGGKAVCSCYGKKGIEKVVRSFKEDATKSYQMNEEKCRKECHVRHFHFLNYLDNKYFATKDEIPSFESGGDRDDHQDQDVGVGYGD